MDLIRKGKHRIISTACFPIGFFASGRLFLINPTMDGTASAGTGLRGVRSRRSCLVSDQAVLRQVYSPRSLSGRFASFSHRGVNEKQPLRGINSHCLILPSVSYLENLIIPTSKLKLINPEKSPYQQYYFQAYNGVLAPSSPIQQEYAS